MVLRNFFNWRLLSMKSSIASEKLYGHLYFASLQKLNRKLEAFFHFLSYQSDLWVLPEIWTIYDCMTFNSRTTYFNQNFIQSSFLGTLLQRSLGFVLWLSQVFSQLWNERYGWQHLLLAYNVSKWILNALFVLQILFGPGTVRRFCHPYGSLHVYSNQQLENLSEIWKGPRHVNAQCFEKARVTENMFN